MYWGPKFWYTPSADGCDVYDSGSIINVPTRISKTRESCLDVILTNASGLIRSSGVLEPGLSNHWLVYAVLNSKLLLPKSEMVTQRSMKQFNQEAFLEDLSKVPFSTAHVFDDPDDVCWCWEKTKFMMIKLPSFLSRKVKLLDPTLLQPIFVKWWGKETVSRGNLITLGAQTSGKITAELEIKSLVWGGKS